MDSLEVRIDDRTAKIAVIGLGYVGLPLAVAFAGTGFAVIGVDVNADVVRDLNRGISHIRDVTSDDVARLVDGCRLSATTDFGRVREADCICICVPTPLGKTKDPDISFVMRATDYVADYLRPGQLVVLESTVYPGATEDVVLPALERSGLTVGRDFYLAFSPERVDPGHMGHTLGSTPKVVGGVTPACTAVASHLYSAVAASVVPVSSPKAAELTKLLENTFRLVNVALANELAQMANVLGVDVWEVIDAATTKPFGFMRFTPGPGLGGHCIPVDPHYLAWKLRSLNYHSRFIEIASQVNGEMPRFVVDQVALALNGHGKCLNGARILIIGVAYKRDVGDVRESPAIDIIRLLTERQAEVSYSDPFVRSLRVDDLVIEGVTLDSLRLRSADCVVIVTDHTGIDYEDVVQEAQLVVDTRNATGRFGSHPHVWRLVQPAHASTGAVEDEPEEFTWADSIGAYAAAGRG